MKDAHYVLFFTVSYCLQMVRNKPNMIGSTFHMLRLHMGFIRLHTVEISVAEYVVNTVVYMFYTVSYSFTYRNMWQLLLQLYESYIRLDTAT